MEGNVGGRYCAWFNVIMLCYCCRKEMKRCAVRVQEVETLNHTRQRSHRTRVLIVEWTTAVVVIVAALNISSTRPRYLVMSIYVVVQKPNPYEIFK